MIKLDVHGADTADDHDLHKQGVTLAGRAHGGGKLIQKALDRRHEAAIKQFAKAKDEATLGEMWDDAVRRGDIPGAYWAVLSHPATTDGLMRRVFGDVHMLSHMVGAANRADIRRLRQLENENADLAVKLEGQQRQLRDGFIARDAMHAVMHVPDRRPPLGSRRGEFADGRFGAVRLHWDHATRERCRQLAIREDIQQHLMSARRHDLCGIQYAVFTTIQRLSHTFEILKSGIRCRFAVSCSAK
jgi:hypothetical protein